MFRLALGIVSLVTGLLLFARWMARQAEAHREAGRQG
jgi:hypothetical protein